MRPEANEYAPYFEAYIDLVPTSDPLTALRQDLARSIQFYQNIEAGKHNYAYAEGKWTVKQVLQHVIDCERVFAYRALRIARGDTLDLPGFDQDSWADVADVSQRPIDSQLNEWMTVRKASISLFEGFRPYELLKLGSGSGRPMSVRAAAFIMVGHDMHHRAVITERYL